MKCNQIFSFLSVFLFCYQLSLAQETFNSEALQEDLTILKDIAVGTSPKFTAQDERAIETLIKQKSQLLEGKSLSVIEFLNFIGQMNMSTRFDEHASLFVEEDVLLPLLSKKNLFPLPLKIIGSRVVVNVKDAPLPYGSMIHTINDESIDSVIDSLVREYNTFSQREIIEPQFSILYLIKKGGSEEYKLNYSTPSDPSVIAEATISGIGINDWVQQMNGAAIYPLDRPNLNNLLNTKHYPEHDAYYFQLNSFIWDNESQAGLFNRLRSGDKNFAKLFKRTFAEINKSKAKNLIIDLRANTGGNVKVPGILYSYLAKEAYTEQVRIEIPDFVVPHEEYIIKLDNQEVKQQSDVAKFLKVYQSVFQELDSSFYWNFIEKQEKEPNKQAFQGNVYLLVGGSSISASAYFTALFKSENRGTILGEELGGSHHSITAGTDITYRLPNTKIQVTVPLMVVNFADELYESVPEKKVMPEELLSDEAAYRYFLEVKDPELGEVFRLIGERN